MEKECCNIKFTETDKGFRAEVTGDEIKEKCKLMIENYCKEDGSWQEFFKNFCPPPSKN